jgi:hypothetical protein
VAGEAVPVLRAGRQCAVRTGPRGPRGCVGGQQSVDAGQPRVDIDDGCGVRCRCGTAWGFPAWPTRQVPHSQSDRRGEVRLLSPQQSAHTGPLSPRLPWASHQPPSWSCLPGGPRQPRGAPPMREARPPGRRRAVPPSSNRTTPLHTTGSTPARGDRPRLARPCSPALAIRARGQVLAHLSLRYRQLTSVAVRPVAPGHLSERHVRAAYHQRSRTSLAPSSRQAADSSTR